MNDRERYAPGPANGPGAKGREKWTLILVRGLPHSPEKVWRALPIRRKCESGRLSRFVGSEHEPVYHTSPYVSLIYVTIH